MNQTSARVLHVINGLFAGGGHQSTALLVSELNRRKCADARLCTLSSKPVSMFGVAAEVSVPYDGRYNEIRTLLGTARRLRTVIANQGCDIVHSHGFDADLITALATLGTKVHHVSHLRVMPPALSGRLWRRRLARPMFSMVAQWKGTRFVAVSDAVRDAMCGYYRLPIKRVVTVRNGVDTKRFTPSERSQPIPREFVIGTAARLVSGKGLEDSIQAAATLARAGIKCQLRIAGEGPGREALVRAAEAASFSSSVVFEGRLTNMPEFYNRLNLFVLPSVSEGLPMSVLEAMACGVPTIATAVGGVPEVIRHNIDGILIPPNDSGALVSAMKQVLLTPSLAHRLGSEAVGRASTAFSIDRVINEVSAFYASLSPSYH